MFLAMGWITQRVIAVVKYVIEVISRYKGIPVIDVLLDVDMLYYQEPKASNKICDHKYNYNQSENLVRIHRNLL